MSRDKDKGLNAMSWKRQFNSENTISCDYLGHPDNKVRGEGDALESWVNRAEEKIIKLISSLDPKTVERASGFTK